MLFSSQNDVNSTLVTVTHSPYIKVKGQIKGSCLIFLFVGNCISDDVYAVSKIL